MKSDCLQRFNRCCSDWRICFNQNAGAGPTPLTCSNTNQHLVEAQHTRTAQQQLKIVTPIPAVPLANISSNASSRFMGSEQGAAGGGMLRRHVLQVR
jgi:hypothetical protein